MPVEGQPGAAVINDSDSATDVSAKIVLALASSSTMQKGSQLRILGISSLSRLSIAVDTNGVSPVQ